MMPRLFCLVLGCTLLMAADAALPLRRLATPQRPTTDYCDILGQDDIQGMKSGFMAGNQVYYAGGHVGVWKLQENETIGLTHPFSHDLRSRGTAIATYNTSFANFGSGNDLDGWTYYVATKVAYGTVITPGGQRLPTPAPTRMFWRPD